MHLVITILFLTILQTPTPTIFVTVVDEAQQPLAGQRVLFEDETRQLSGRCVTDAAGTCEIQVDGFSTGGFLAERNGSPAVENPPPLIRGQLILPPSGIRLVIWPADENIAVAVQLDVSGHVHVSGHGDHAHDAPPEPTATAIPVVTLTLVASEPSTEQTASEETDIIDALISAENTPIQTTAEPIQPRPIWPMVLCSGVFILLWGGAVVWIYRRQPA